VICPKCGGDTRVTDKRHQKRTNRNWRRRECRRCGYRFTTYEEVKECEVHGRGDGASRPEAR